MNTKLEALIVFLVTNSHRESIFLTPNPQHLIGTKQVLDAISDIFEVPQAEISAAIEREYTRQDSEKGEKSI